MYHFNTHFSLHVFFANDIFFYVPFFMFILDYGNDVGQKANLSDFLI